MTTFILHMGLFVMQFLSTYCVLAIEGLAVNETQCPS